MKTSSAKAKGRNLQNWLKQKIIEIWNVKPGDVRTAIMGETGTDIKFGADLHEQYPYDFECKNQEVTKIIYDMYEQRINGVRIPVLVVKKNHKPPLAIVSVEDFLRITKNVK